MYTLSYTIDVRSAKPIARSGRGGTPGSKRRPPDQARTSVLAAADRLFYEHGVRAVGVDAVAEAAGVTKRTLYYHFPTKEALVAAYLEERDGQTLLAIEQRAGEHALPGDRVLAIFEFLESWFKSPAYRGCPFNNVVAEQIGGDAAAVARRHKAAVTRWFSEQAQLAGATEPHELGAELLLLLDGALNGAQVFGSAAPARAARRAAQILLREAGVKTSQR